VLNAKDDLAKTIISLKNQYYKNFEYIVIDGGSTDGTVDVIKNNQEIINYWYSNLDHGIYDAMNKGIEQANGKYIGILNAGDQYSKEGLEIINKYLEKDDDLDFIFGSVLKKNLRWGYRKFRIFWNFDFYSSHSSGFFIKRISQEKLGKYNLKYKISSDYDLFYRMIIKERMKGISTKKNEIIGIFKSGTSYSSKFSYLDHLKEETLIRIDNKQNILIIFIIFITHFFKNNYKINNRNKFRLMFKTFFQVYKNRN